MVPQTDHLAAGNRAALAGDMDAAISEFRSALAADPGSVEAALGLLEAYGRTGRLADANRLAGELSDRAGADSGVNLALARLCERQGQAEEARVLLLRADLSEASAAYPLYLRVLVELGRFEEAILEAERGLNGIWRMHALLAKGLSLLHFGDIRGAARAFEELAQTDSRAVLDDWAAALERAGAREPIRRLLEGAERDAAAPEVFETLRARLTDVPS